MWVQRQLQVGPFPRGFHLVTDLVLRKLPEIRDVQQGLLHVFIQHTSASLTINENADPDVATDLESSLSAVAREDFPYTHTLEGPDDMPAHVKCSLLGAGVTVPVMQGRLALGTWQGIFVCEHRNRGTARHLVLTVHGQE